MFSIMDQGLKSVVERELGTIGSELHLDGCAVLKLDEQS